MIKYGRQSVLLVAITLTLLFGGCSTEIRQPEPPKQEVAVGPVVQSGRLVPLPRSTGARIEEHRDETEEVPVIAEENAVFFTLGSAALSHAGRQKLEIIAERLIADRTLHVSLIGYANDNGSSSFNLAVSDNRVSSVAAFLRKRGVHGEQIKVQALGSEKTPSNCRSSKCRQQFRRVDLVILNKKQTQSIAWPAIASDMQR